MTLYRRQLEAALRAVTVLSSTRFAWFGQASPRLPRKTLRALDAGAARAHLVSQLRQSLYMGFYTTGHPVPDATLPNRPARCPEFVHALSRANAGKGCRAQGWLVRFIEGTTIVGERDEIRLKAFAGSWCESAGGAMRAGAMVDFLLPKEQLGISPGFYLAQSDIELDVNGGSGIVRVYWNVTPTGAVVLMANLTSALNDIGVAFRFKVIGHPDCFNRCDSAVLYFQGGDFERAAPAIARAYAKAARDIEPAVPAFTKRLAPGIALAEDPAEGVSFGWHRCGLVADAIIDAHERRVDRLEQRLDRVRARFAEAGLDDEAPYLNSGSRDRYSLDLGFKRVPRSAPAHEEIRMADRPASPERALELAERIGEQLTSAARWHDGRCTWLAPDHGPHPCTTAPNKDVCRTLGPSLYDGASGIALFLAELASATRNTTFATAAVGAARQALFRMPEHVASGNLGAYYGWPGIALAVLRVGRLTEPQLVERARALIESSAPRADDAKAFDVLSGAAGGVLALVSLARSLGESAYLERAAMLGNALCEQAERTPHGSSWRAPRQRRGHNLTGFSQGTAGVATALIELFEATRTERYLETAQQAFAYERHWFSPDQHDGPDFRRQHGPPGKSTVPPHSHSSWCHGAPGFALSQLRAAVLLQDPACQAELDCAFDTTARGIERAITSGSGTASLCHGITGNVEILRYGCEQVGDRAGHLATTAKRGTAWVMDHAQKYLDSQETAVRPFHPGLMLGAAGVGLFLLRIACPTTPSALLIV